MLGKPEGARESSELPGVNVEEGWRSMESGSHNLANVHGEAPLPSGGAPDFFFKDVSILSWLLG